MKKKLLLLTVSFSLLVADFAHAQPGSIDTTFNTYDIGTGVGADNDVLTTSLQSDGKIIIGGVFHSYNGTVRNQIARLNTDGSLDTTFNPGTGANYAVLTTSLQSDGKIIIGGDFFSYNGTGRNHIARLNTDGSLDTTFNPGTGANSAVQTTSLQSDGKIIIGGDFTLYNGTMINCIARLNTDGSLDNTFNTGTGANNIVYTTCIQSDSKIIIGGDFTSYAGTGRNRIARLNADGSLDNTFNPGTGANDDVYDASLQSDGKIIIGGGFTSFNGAGRNRIARLNSDGSLENIFNPGAGANDIVYAISIQSDGKIIIGGEFTIINGTGRNRITRLNTDGSLDNTFNPGTGANSIAYTTCIQSDGKIIIGGDFFSYNGTERNRIARLNTNASNDSTFNISTGANSPVYTTSIQSDGKIIIGGNFTAFNGVAINHIARLNTDGSLDTTFNPGTGANSDVYTTSIQSDGKIIIGGFFTDYNGTGRNHIARLNANGTLDVTFNPTGSGADFTVNTTSIQSDGKIIIGGNFTTVNGQPKNRIARLNANGTLDVTFNPTGSGADYAIETTSIQSDGKIIIGGLFTTVNGQPRNRIARLNADGILVDFSFSVGTGANYVVNTTFIQSDGKIIIGGDFTAVNGQPKNHIARLNTDGSLDNTFNPGTGANLYVRTTSIQSDGKIIIGGDFTTYNSTAVYRIGRINTDGSLDTTFNPGTGANNNVYTTSLQSDGKIIIGGRFTAYDGTGRNHIARINGDNIISVEEITKDDLVFLFPNPATNELRIENAELRIREIEIYNTLGERVFSKHQTTNDKQQTVNVSQLLPGVYFVAVTDEKGNKITRRFIKL